MNAYLLLANGMVFAGQSVGAEGVTVGEVVFATGMVGFEETLTDPSYYGQIITQTYPLIGNYGMNKDDMESDRIWAKGYIVREACTTPSNWRCEETLDSFLKKNNTIGIEGIDTRHLTRIIRESGVMNGAILTTFDPADPANKAETEKLLETIRAYAVTDAVKSVTCEKPEVFNEKGETHIVLMHYGCKRNIVRCLVKRGCKVTVMDVRATVSAAKADTFFFVRPGTDYAMNLAVLHVLISEKLYDPHMLPYIDGFGELEERVRPCTPEWAETETGIKADRIVRLARELAEAAPRVLWYPGWFTARYADSFVTVRSAYLINALLGSIGARGGMPISLSPKETGKRLRPLSALYPNITKPMADKADWQQPGLLHRAFDAAVTGDPYPVRAYISMRHNILSSLPDPDTLRSKLDKLDLIVAITTTWSPTADYADIVLPLSPALSRESILASKLGLKPQFFRRQRAVQPRFDTRADWEILCGLASRLGLDKLAFSRIEDIWNYQLEGTGLGIEAFDATGFVPLAPAPRWKTLAETTLPTPSGKIEACSRLWAASGHDTLPPYTAPERPAAPDQFRVIPGRAALHTQASTTNNPLLSELAPTNTLWIHTERAQALGIADGDWVEVCTATGPVGRLRAKVTTGIHPEAVFMLHGFGRKTPQETRAFGKGVADEACMVSGLEHEDPLGGGLALQKHFVTIRKAEETN